MRELTRRGIKEGIGFGLIAGAIFGVMEVIGAALMGDPPLMPVRMFASTVRSRSDGLGVIVLHREDARTNRRRRVTSNGTGRHSTV